MKIFDVHIRSDSCTDADLKNLRYFETEHVITTAYDARPFEQARDLMSYFQGLIDHECSRLRRCGLIPHVALGVLPGARPRRTHYEVWRELPGLLTNPAVVAIGEIGVWEDVKDQWDLFERQIKLALEAGPRPVIITPPPELRITMTYKMMQIIERIGFPPHQVMINYTDDRFIENVLQSGFCAGVAVGATPQTPRQAAGILVRVLESQGSAERVILNSALRAGGSDVLAIPKTVAALQELGMIEEEIEALTFENASKLFLGHLSG
ncbi:MAG: hypothetical protein ACNA8W_19440 [Bradymonadaceae bacterium]